MLGLTGSCQAILRVLCLASGGGQYPSSFGNECRDLQLKHPRKFEFPHEKNEGTLLMTHV